MTLQDRVNEFTKVVNEAQDKFGVTFALRNVAENLNEKDVMLRASITIVEVPGWVEPAKPVSGEIVKQ